MTRLADAGFESQIVTTSTVTNGEADNSSITGTPTIDTGNPRSGLAALKFSTLGDTWQYGITAVLDRGFFFRVPYRPSGTPSATIFSILQASNGATLNWRVNHLNSGKIELRNTAGEVIFTSASALPNNAYSRIEVKWLVPTAGLGIVELVLNGTVLFSSAAVNVANLASNSVRSSAGTSIGGITFLIDDLALNDDQGASQNGYPGEGKLLLLKPVSDNARVGWTNGASGTTSLFDAVDNRPPVGVIVGSSTATSQIKDVNNNATDTYDANLQSYAEAGILSTDVITMVKPLLRIGNSTTTQRNAAVAMQSNPVIAELAGLGSVSGSAAGTDPAGWSSKIGTRAYAPAVVLGTQPVMRVRRASAVAETLTIDQMGLYVEYRAGLKLELNDSAAFSESRVDAPAPVKAETIALTDSSKLATGLTKADAQALTDSLAKADGVKRADAQVFVDSLAKKPGIARSDGLTLAESRLLALGHVLTDPAPFGDAQTRSIALRLSDGLSLVDVLKAAEAIHLALGEALTLSEALTRALSHVLADGFGLLDALTRGSTLTRSDAFTLGDEFTLELGAATRHEYGRQQGGSISRGQSGEIGRGYDGPTFPVDQRGSVE